jgi:hypothetical protein
MVRLFQEGSVVVAAGESTASSALIPRPLRTGVCRDPIISGGQNPTQAAPAQTGGVAAARSSFMPTMTLEPGQAFPAGANILRAVNDVGVQQP